MDANEKARKILGRAKLDEVYEYINDCVIKNTYVIYDSKRNKAVCTRCGTVWDIAPGEYSGCHNAHEVTLCCEETATIKSVGRGRNNLEETFRVIYMFRYRKTAYVMIMNCRANFVEFGKPTIRSDTEDLFEFSAKEQHRYHREIDYYKGKTYWKEMKSIRLPSPPSGSWAYMSPYYDTYIYDGNAEEIFKNTDLKYLWIPDLLKTLGAAELITYLAQGMKYQSVEMLYKAGFTKIVEERLKEYRTGAVYWRGKSLQKALRLSMGDIRRIREKNPSCRELEVYQKLSEQERRDLPWAFVSDMTYCHYNEYDDIRVTTSLLKFANYIQNQINTFHLANVSVARGYWCDYIKTATKLGMDTRRNSILFPENLKAAHDEVTEMYQAEKNKSLDAEIRAFARIIEYDSNGLMIVTALSQQMLNQESAKLGHCVKTYGERLRNGKCRIYFVRHTNDPDTPFYTLETTPRGELVQCRGQKNCGMTDEVKAFVDSFVKELKKSLKKEDKKCQKKSTARMAAA